MKKVVLLVFLLVVIPSLVLGVRIDSGDLFFVASVSNSTLSFPTYFMDVGGVVVTGFNITLVDVVCFNGVSYDRIFYDVVNSSRDARFYCVDSVVVEPFGSSPSVGGVLPEPDVVPVVDEVVVPVFDVNDTFEEDVDLFDVVDGVVGGFVDSGLFWFLVFGLFLLLVLFVLVWFFSGRGGGVSGV